ncbi:hypothetical protein ASG01_01425 [Chryseobacterium sp. Leaf180]|jgi:uncharacterized membrane protein YidH (DUF202 family)|uniref:hypothetical protein n=1 Tax=Chryseobacterium sp. Leaf180 TaxID=1736289 RepID=UPI0006F52A9F|nr:hypothetical protein [Chryseobacterium sp. Leaf180]KQR94573.1 hypothetical protein ASG01_01425 [Chryseobacterium sp. Leaf180]
MKAKYGLILFLAGFVIDIFGAWLKITHITFGTVNANIVFTLGSFLQILAILFIIYKIFKFKKFKEFLNQ